MRFITSFLIFLAFFLSITICYAIDEVVLDIDGAETEGLSDSDVITDEEWYFDMGGKSLQQKLKEIRAREIKDISKANYLFEEILTKIFDKSPLITMQ